MKRLYKYVSALGFTGLLMVALIGTANAQHRGGGGGFHGGGFHGGGGGFHGSSGFRGGNSFRGGSSFRGNASVRANSSFRGAVGSRGAAAYRGGVYNRGGVAYGNHYAYRGGVYNRGAAYRGGYYRGGSYYHGGYYRGGAYYHGYYGPGFRFGFGWGYPHIGLYLGVLPYGYYPFYYNSYPYYYYGGAFYRPYNGGYQVVAPPMGAMVPNLPSNAQSIVIDGDQYYEASGVYYQESQDDNGKSVYVVVGKDGVLNTANGGGSINDQPMSDNDDPLMDNNTTANDTRMDNNAPAEQPVVTAKVGDVVDQLPADTRKVTLNKKKYYVSPDNVFYEEFKDADGTGYRVASVPGAEQ